MCCFYPVTLPVFNLGRFKYIIFEKHKLWSKDGKRYAQRCTQKAMIENKIKPWFP